MMEFEDPFTPDEKELYLVGVYNKLITKLNLSIGYHIKISLGFRERVKAGYKEFSEPKFEPTYKGLQKNVYIFSAAKQYQQVRTMTKFIEDKGVKSTFKEFKDKAGQVFDEYNKNYLRTEYDTAVGQSQMARDWEEALLNKDIFPNITYHTQRDARVRDEHRILDGITLPIDHKFWNLNMPKNGFNCRCFTTTNDDKVTDLKTVDLSLLKDKKAFPDLFRMNPGKDKMVFDPAVHPYFKVAKGDGNLKKNNFNLPLP
jgi:SPP1 gp7 family putative phage head morphogenesis protein